jgi:hypothetical protein
MRRIWAFAAPSILWSATAFAQQPTDQEPTAAAQFDRGLAAMNEGKYDVACPALTESVRLDPRPGAIFTLAECEARWGHVASADAHYDDYLARFARMTTEQQKQQRGREKIAEQKRRELRAQIPQLQIRLPANAAAGAVVRRDGIVLGAPSLGVFLPVDPGAHVLVVEMPDGGKTEQTVNVELAARREVMLDVPAPVRSHEPTRPPVVEPDRSATARTPWLAYGALGIGIVGVGVGVAGGVSALSQKATVDQHCTGVVCDRDGKSAADGAKSAALVSTIGFAVGGVGLATGIVLLVTRPRPASTGMRTIPLVGVGDHGALLGATGVF